MHSVLSTIYQMIDVHQEGIKLNKYKVTSFRHYLNLIIKILSSQRKILHLVYILKLNLIDLTST